MYNQPTMLIQELIPPILVAGIRAVRARHRGTAAAHIVAILNTLPHTLVPELAYAALLAMPWIDSDTAARLGDLWLLNVLHHKLSRAPYNRPLQFTSSALNEAGGRGHVHVLEWWKEHVGLPVYRMRGVLNQAVALGRLDVLEWWTRQPQVLDDYEDPSITAELYLLAARHGHMHVLPLLEQVQQHQQRHTNEALYVSCLAMAVASNRVPVFEWFLDRAASLTPSRSIGSRYLTDALVVACALGDRASLSRFLEALGWADLMTSHVAAFACASGDISFLDHCASLLGHNSIDSPLAYCVAAAFGHLHVIRWLASHNVKVAPVSQFATGNIIASTSHWTSLGWQQGWQSALQHTPSMLPLLEMARLFTNNESVSPLAVACATGQIHVLDAYGDKWINECGATLAIRSEVVQVASECNQVEALDWLLMRGWIDMTTDLVGDCVRQACIRGHLPVLEWWYGQSKDEFVDLERLAIRAAVACGQVAVLDWWLRSTQGFLSTSWDSLMHVASEHCHASVLEWLFGHQNHFSNAQAGTTDHDPIRFCGRVQHPTPSSILFDALWWWTHSGFDTSRLQVSVAEWSDELECETLWNPLFLDPCNKAGVLHGAVNLDHAILASGSVLVLEWAFKYSKRELVYTEQALTSLVSKSEIPILEWWKQSGLPVKHGQDLDYSYSAAVEDWWITSGLL